MMSCERCGEGERALVRRAKVAERAGQVVVVLGVPMEECAACGERFIDWDVARRLDDMIRATLAGGAEVATRHFDEQAAA